MIDFIEWSSTPERNVSARNDTADLYRYFDCTEAAEFLYACVNRTVEEDLPREIHYLRRHDEAVRQIMELIEMPDNLAGRLLLLIRQYGGRLAKTRRESKFIQLTDQEVTALESIVKEVFAGSSDR